MQLFEHNGKKLLKTFSVYEFVINYIMMITARLFAGIKLSLKR